MTNVELIRVSLPLKRVFTISRGATSQKVNVLVIMNNRYNGEASGSVYYGPSLEDTEKDIRRGITIIEEANELSIHTLYELNSLALNPIARSALIGMMLNYLSGESQRYPWELLNLGAPVGVKSSITISIDTPDAVRQAIKDSPNPIVKVKLGSDHDMEVINVLGEFTHRDIRVDANGAWTLEQAEEMVYYLTRNGIRVVEQPTETSKIADWPHLKPKETEVEFVIDEGLESYKDYQRFAEYVDAINLKMEKTGGILEAMRIARLARDDNKKVMLGCMVESSVGIAQSIYMSSLADYFDLDGPQLIEHDIARGIRYERESIEVDREIIGGPKLKRDVIEKYILH